MRKNSTRSNPGNATLILFTSSYPYAISAERTFINPELPILASFFEKIIIIPYKKGGVKENLSSFHNVEVKEELITYLHHNSLIGKILKLCVALCSPLFYGDIYRHREILMYPATVKRLMYWIASATLTQRWVCQFIQQNSINLHSTLFFTYWFDFITTGIGLAKYKFPKISLISKAHGCDIYSERYIPPYIPLRHESLKLLDHLFLASDHARDYMISHYSTFKDKFEVFGLSTRDPKVATQSSHDGILRIVSCSLIVPEKRLELLIQGLTELGKRKKLQQFEWYHIGDGPSQHAIERFAQQQLPSNVTGNFLGFVPNEQIFCFYAQTPIDVFITVSQSEGGRPVSIMEAQSCSIPVIGTSVGGIPEIVHSDNGLLLSDSPTPGEIADALDVILSHPELRHQKARLSRLNWEQHFNAERIPWYFVERLQTLLCP